RGVVDRVEQHPETRVEHLRRHPVDILIGEARLRIPGTRARILVTARHAPRVLARIQPGERETPDRDRPQVLADEEITDPPAGLVPDARGALAEAAVDARHPEVRGLEHVRIRRDELRLHHVPTLSHAPVTVNATGLEVELSAHPEDVVVLTDLDAD